jgi:hypothetical protein
VPVVTSTLLAEPFGMPGSALKVCDLLRTGIGPTGKEKMSKWIAKTIKELLGEEEQTLVRALPITVLPCMLCSVLPGQVQCG